MGTDQARVFTVTWATVVEINATSSEPMDMAWAVCKAAERMREVLASPDAGDNFFLVQELGNRPAPKIHMTLSEAYDAYPVVDAGTEASGG